MNLEQERKFLVRWPKVIKGYAPTHIIQMYLVDRKDHSVRVRIINSQRAYICYKYYLTNTAKEEIEYPFPMDAATDILEKENYISILEKKRYEIDGWDVDSYGDGLFLAEFEFSASKPFPEGLDLPIWVGEEVTGIYKYTNVALAKKYGLVRL